jgi:hypothetical protein
MTSLEAFTVGAVLIKGRVHVLDRDAYELRLADLPDGLCVEVTIAEAAARPGPRAQQTRYWWAIVVPICARRFQTTDRQMSRDLLCERFGFEDSALQDLVPVKASLSWLTADEMSGLIDWARDWAADREIDIPVPDKDWRKK